jgi:hypothetical protein
MKYLMILGVLGSAFAVAGGLSECDLSQVVKVRYCEACAKVLEPSEVLSEAVYYSCASCRINSPVAGDCAVCGKPLEKKVTGKSACRFCYADSIEAEACLKVYYECKGCAARMAKEGTCPDCGIPLARKESKAIVEYVCGSCGTVSLKPGACTFESCAARGKPLKRTCSMSGVFPHVKGE